MATSRLQARAGPRLFGAVPRTLPPSLTATRLTELDLPLDWSEQRRRKMKPYNPEICRRPRPPPRPACRLRPVWALPKRDCINGRQGNRTKQRLVARGSSLSYVPNQAQPGARAAGLADSVRGTPLRRTRWRGEQNSKSRFSAVNPGCSGVQIGIGRRDMPLPGHRDLCYFRLVLGYRAPELNEMSGRQRMPTGEPRKASQRRS
jgi:hypothetical protein